MKQELEVFCSKTFKKTIPSYIKLGGFSIPVRHRGQEKTCKICSRPGHFARDCDLRGRCFICGSGAHRAAWHEQEDEEEEQQTPVIIIPAAKEPEAEYDSTDNRDEERVEEKTPEEVSRKEEEEIGREKTQEPQREKKDTKTSKNRQDNKPKHVPDGNSISKPKTKTGFWDEAVRKENYRKRKIREEVGHDENKKVARDEETNSESELSSDMEAQIGQSGECLDSGKEETAEMDEAESYAEYQNEREEFTLYTRGRSPTT